MKLPKTIPVFPLSNFIIFPKTTVPLNIFEPRYIDMVNDSMKADKFIGMVQPKITKNFDDNKLPSLHKVGCLGKITSFREADDGRYLIDLKGVIRFEIKKEIDDSALEDLLDHGLEDYNTDDDLTYLYSSFEELASFEKILVDKNFDIESANIIWKPNLTVKIEKKEDLDKLIRLNEELEDNDDVQNCFSNLDFDSELLEVNNA